jgi:hypothetical protein
LDLKNRKALYGGVEAQLGATGSALKRLELHAKQGSVGLGPCQSDAMAKERVDGFVTKPIQLDGRLMGRGDRALNALLDELVPAGGRGTSSVDCSSAS